VKPGQPLSRNMRRYPGDTDTVYAAASTDEGIYFAIGDGPSTILERDQARQLALDILATTGVDE